MLSVLEMTQVLLCMSRIEKMKQDAMLINCSRGGLVDTAALVDALEGGKIGGAAMVGSASMLLGLTISQITDWSMVQRLV